MPNFDVAYIVHDDEGLPYEGESDWADSVATAMELGHRADCDWFIIYRAQDFRRLSEVVYNSLTGKGTLNNG